MKADTLIVIAKEPVAGRVKTRLQTEFTPAEAAALARASLADTLTAVQSTPVRRYVLALDGQSGPWLPSRFEVIKQRGDGLAERLAEAFEDAYAGEPMLLVGMDTPQLTRELLDVDWADHDAVLGLTEDGGYWALGLRQPDRRALVGVPMSTDHTGADQLARLRLLGYKVLLLPMLRDMDTPEDAAVLAAQFPALRMSRLHRRLQHSASPGLLFEKALSGARVVATGTDGQRVPSLSEIDRWQAPADEVDRLALSRCEGPVLDIGCGPGRIVTALAERGIPALGVDISAEAVLLTTNRGAPALRRPVQEPLPGEGRWGSVLLMDGNIGIGGAPALLLRRCAELVRPDGLVLVEVDPDDNLDDTAPIILHADGGRRSKPLPWARVGTRAVLRYALAADLLATEDWRTPHRAFLAFRRSPATLRQAAYQ
jgi:rSAM/selenodomain-associated transferase 1